MTSQQAEPRVFYCFAFLEQDYTGAIEDPSLSTRLPATPITNNMAWSQPIAQPACKVENAWAPFRGPKEHKPFVPQSSEPPFDQQLVDACKNRPLAVFGLLEDM